MLRYRDAFTLPALLKPVGCLQHTPGQDLLPLGRRCPAGEDEGAFIPGEESRPSPVRPNDLRSRPRRRKSGEQRERDRKSWPHVLSPAGRGGGACISNPTRMGRAALLFVLAVGVGATVAVAQQPHAAKASAIEVLI